MKYLVKISPVSRNQTQVINYLKRLLGPEETAKAKELVNNGGVIYDNLNKTAADNVANQLRELGAVVKVAHATSENPNEGYRVRLISAGRNKLAVIKEVRDITGLGLKEAKELVENPGEIGVYVSEKDANDVKKKVESAGAKAVVEKIHGSVPEPEPLPEPVPEPDDPGKELDQPMENDGFIVFGTVKVNNDNPATGLTVRAWDRDLRSEQLLGETLTDANGNYSISYTSEEFKNAEKGTADLIIRAFNSVGTLLAESEIYFNVAPEQRIDLSIPGEKVIKPSQYEVLVDQLTPLLDGAGISELTNEDVWFLTQETGVPLNHISFIAEDARLAERTGIPKSVFWGMGVKDAGVLYRETELTSSGSGQVPVIDLATLLEIPLEELMENVKMSVSEGLIPSNLVDQFDEIEKRFEELISSNTQESTGARRNRLKELGKIAGLSEKKAVEFAKRFNEISSDDKTWDDLVKEGVVKKQEAESLRLTVGLAELTGNNVSLTEAIKKKPLTVSGVPISSISELAVIEQKDWEEILTENNIKLPEGNSLSEYATQLAGRVEGYYPTQVFRHRIITGKQEDLGGHLEKVHRILDGNKGLFSRVSKSTTSVIEEDNIEYGNLNSDEVEELKPSILRLTNYARTFRHLQLAEILDSDNSPDQKLEDMNSRIRNLEIFFENNKEKDLRTASITKLNGEEAEITFEGIDSNSQALVKKQVLAYQRTLNIAQKSDNARLLLQGGFDSAHTITKETIESFSSKLGRSIIEVAPLYNNAIALADIADLVTGTLIHFTPGTSIATAAENRNENLINALKKIDGYEDLFGSQTWCNCEHCRSIFGPAAYFVDLMRFVEEKILRSTPGLKGHHIDLQRRRPDLWKLQLTCDNTTKLVPNLTIVNEILSKYISEAESLFPAASDPAPEEIDSAVLSKLRYGTRSFSQPVNISFTELQLYLSKFDISLHQIEQVVSGKKSHAGLKKLGISPENIKVLTESVSDTDAIKRRYGLAPEDNLSEIELQKILQVTRLERLQIESLIKSDFINGTEHPRIFIDQREVEGEIQPVEEYLLNANAGRLDRLHRFVRLWRIAEWSVGELDYIVVMLERLNTVRDLDRETLSLISEMMSIQQSMSLTVPELCSILEDIPVVNLRPGQESHFDTLFNNAFISNGNNRLSLVRPYMFWHPPYDQESTEGSADPELPRLLGALKTDRQEFDSLMFNLRGSITAARLEVDVDGDTTWRTHVELNRRNLSLLYRHKLVAGKLGLSIAELFQAMQLTQTQVPPVLGRFNELNSLLEFLEWQKQADLDIGKLWLAVENKLFTENNEFQVGEEKIRELQDSLSDGVDPLPEKNLSVLLAEFYDLSELNLGSVIRLIPDKFNAPGTDTIFSNDFANWFASADTEEERKKVEEFLQGIAGTNFVFESLGLEDSERQFVGNNPLLFGIDTVNDKPLSLEGVRQIFLYRKLSGFSASESETLNNLLKSGLLNSRYNDLDEQNRSDLSEMLSLIIGEENNYLQSFLSILEPPGQQTGSQIDLLDRLMKILKIAKPAGLNGHTIKSLISDDYDELRNAGNSLKAAIRSSVKSEEEFEKLFGGYRDQINELKRDAFTDFILTKPELQFSDTSDIYNFFLIDTQMQGCGLTSRIVEATGALQLYINRCQLNLEKGDGVHVTPGQIPDEEWEWRKNYRVWEANRKVFLYAENYIRPELRDNKSPEFKKLEERVYEEDLNEHTVEKIYRGYLDGFDDVSSLSIAGSYFDPVEEGSADGLLYLIGRSQSQPVQHYLCTLSIGSNHWSLWEKIDPEMNGKAVSPVVYLNRLYLFWNETETRPKYLDDQEKTFNGYIHTISLKFVTKNAEGIWSAPQEVVFSDSEPDSFTKVYDIKPVIQTIQHHSGRIDTSHQRPRHQKTRFPIHSGPLDNYTLDSRLYNRIFPFVSNRKLYFGYGEESKIYEILFPSKRAVPTSLNTDRSQNFGSYYGNASAPGSLKGPLKTGTIRMGLSGDYFERPDLGGNDLVNLYLVIDVFQSDHHYKDAEELQTEIFDPDQYAAVILCRLPASSIVQPVNNHPHLYILENDEGSAILRRTGKQMVKMTRLQTRVARDLKEILFREGLDKMLSLETQIGLRENWIVDLGGPIDRFRYLQTWGTIVFPLPVHSYRDYIWEIFFHAPFLIAEKLSSEGKYREAESWYRYIFNPTADEVPFSDEKDRMLFPKDRNWRFREFHGEGITKLSEIFDANNPAYQAYRSDPFNPHAIARTRISAYQKAIVMAYINNLISWGDYLFRVDSRESIGEATLVYIMAANILGKRPPEAGACKMPAENIITYEGLDASDEFIVSLENLVLPASGYISLVGTSARMINHLNYDSEILNIADANENVVNTDPVHLKSLADPDSANRLVPLRMEYPVFCVPRNKDLLDYWDRLSDRLYKIRNCMNIDGVRRTLALFQPPIDPALLVRARAAGLSLSDVLDMHAAGLPAYRYAFLLGKARDYCGVVKSFGSALLSAFEKKDIEELQLLRSLQLQNIQKLTTNIREQQVNVARESLASLDTRKELLEYKLDYFDSKEFMNNWELTSQIIAGTALVSHTTATIMSALAPSLKVLPDWQFGTSGLGGHFVSVYGGEKLGGKAQAAAQVLRDVTTGLSMSAGMASTMGSFKRREEEWNYQKEIAKKELQLLEKEKITAEIRLAIAERSLEIHKAEMEQASEVYEYFRNKLTGFGLYSWLSSELRKVYRQSYMMALEISQLAQNAYHFERPDDNTIFIQPGYWESNKAGLLAGEKLLMSLLAMEKSYIETNHREFEIDQAFSLTQIDPAALLMLKQKGECTFEISELFYDLFYPGQYRRKIRSVRLTIPSVTGPYTNVSATLTMTGSQIRMRPEPGANELNSVPDSRTKTIATSTAQNDAGVFELNFMSERYMPFEGAGAVNSKWKLSLPKNFRQFDYNTINDVIVHISYTAGYDELFREKVEGNIEAAEGELVNILQGSSLYRAFNLRQEFSNGFHRLTEQEAGHQVIIKIQNKHFPLFMNGRNLKVEQAKMILVTPAGQTAAGFRIAVNGNIQEGFSADPNFGGLLSADMGNVFQSGIIKEHTLAIEAGGDLAPEVPAAGPAAAIDVEKLEDIILFIEYRLT